MKTSEIANNVTTGTASSTRKAANKAAKASELLAKQNNETVQDAPPAEDVQPQTDAVIDLRKDGESIIPELNSTPDAAPDAPQADASADAQPKPELILEGVTFVEISTTSVSRAKPAASMRQDGYLAFTQPASDMLATFNTLRFKLGNDKAGNLFLVPAKADDKNTVGVIKNGTKLSIKAPAIFAKIGAAYENRYSVDVVKMGSTDVVSLTLKPKAVIEAEKVEEVANATDAAETAPEVQPEA